MALCDWLGLGLTGAVGSKGDRAVQIHSYLFGQDQIWTVDGRSNGRGRVDQDGAAPVAGGEEDGGPAHGLGSDRGDRKELSFSCGRFARQHSLQLSRWIATSYNFPGPRQLA